MKILSVLVIALTAATAVAEEKKPAAKPAGEAWQNVDKELTKGANKIGEMLQKQGIDTKGEPTPQPTAAPAPVSASPPAAEEGFTAKLNRFWFRLLGKGDDALNKQRTDENKEPAKSN